MRPTNKHQIIIYTDGDKAKADFWLAVPTNIWDVEVDKLEPVTFKECYSDGCNASDGVASAWLLVNFESMCPTAIDSDVLVDKADPESEKWEVLDFQVKPEKKGICPVDAAPVLAVLEEFGFEYYYPGDHCGHEWPCVETEGRTLIDPDVSKLNDLLLLYGWEMNEVIHAGSPYVWDMRPVNYDDNDNEYEDGWHGILLNHVFIVDDGDRNAEALWSAGFRVLKHTDTDTVIAQVTFCGMSNEVNRAHAGFLLAVERGWPILTSQGWRRPVA